MKSLRMGEKQRMYYACLARGDASLHFSQFGEDVVISTLFRRVQGGFYVDIGAHHPFRFSNTALLHHEQGWSGINVDLDERYVAAMRTERPRDVSVCCAVGAEDGEIEALIVDKGAFNSIDPGRSERYAEQFPDLERRRVPMRTLGSLLAEYLPEGRKVDFLNIDAEGVDEVVLGGNDWSRCRPSVIAVEAHGMDLGNPATNPSFRLLVEQGYRLRSYCFATAIYQLLRG